MTTASPTTSARRRLSPAARREQLVALGLERLKRGPFDQALVDEVISAAGISKGLLFHYFPTVRAYQLALVEAATAELVTVLTPDPDLDVLDQLGRGLDAWVRYIEDHQEGYVAMVRGAGADEALLALFERTRDEIVAIVVDGMVRAGLAAEDSPLLRLAARGYTASVEETTLLWLRDRPCSRARLMELLQASALQLAAAAADLADLADPRS